MQRLVLVSANPREPRLQPIVRVPGLHQEIDTVSSPEPVQAPNLLIVLGTALSGQRGCTERSQGAEANAAENKKPREVQRSGSAFDTRGPDCSAQLGVVLGIEGVEPHVSKLHSAIRPN